MEPAVMDGQHRRLLEALLFASATPLTEATLVERLPEGAAIKELLADLSEDYANRGVNLVKVGKGWAFRTAVDLAPMLTIERVSKRKLSRAAIETMAIVAYHQPVTRAEIEEIRGVGLSRGTMDVLFEAGWIRPRGRRRTPGRPVTWGTTEGFLDQFGLENLDDLPGLDDLKAAGLLDSRPAIATLDRKTKEAVAAEAEASGEEDEEVVLDEDELEDGDDGLGPPEQANDR
ncbi:MAG: SMC-Scp complex subunit ScpB [Proteobacteria bacterium]|nr:SMC-Scp complex subunit ScpB [Pseudomonadota bacterium]